MAPGHFALLRIRISGKDGSFPDQHRGPGFLILVNPEKVTVLHQGDIFRLQAAQVSSHHQRNSAQAPQGELHPVFLI